MSSDAPSTPPAETNIDSKLVRALLKSQHQDLASLPIRIMESGWDNVMVKLGDDLALRLPRRAVAEPLILSEQKWLPVLAPLLPLPIPNPIRVGKPEKGYPYHWSVVHWLPGEAADVSPPDPSEYRRLVHFLKALHSIELPANAPTNSVRDCPLVQKQADTEKRMDVLSKETSLITSAVTRIWENGLKARVDVPKTWIAGDIHARNVLVDSGKISAFIDWGDMCAGDPATDLASIWGLLSDTQSRKSAIDLYGMSNSTIARAKAWAVFFGVILAETGRKDTPRHARMGEAILRRLTEDE
ncbi:MAG: aminoglycoside phosphotransferase family protein [Parasphingorhabdus sp.]